MLEPNRGAAVSNLLDWNIAEHLTSKQKKTTAPFLAAILKWSGAPTCRTAWCHRRETEVRIQYDGLHTEETERMAR